MSMSIKKLFSTKKAVVVGASVALTLGLSGAAFAYFTSNGTGSGTASAGTGLPVTIALDASITGLTPGGPIVPVGLNIHNPDTGNEYVNTVTVAIDPSWTGFTVGGHPACTAADFSIVNPTQTVNADIAGGATYDFNVAHGNATTIQMIDNGLDQDSCNGFGSIPLVFTSN